MQLFPWEAVLLALGMAALAASGRVIDWLRSDRRDLAEGRVVRNLVIVLALAAFFLGGLNILYRFGMEFAPVETVLYIKDSRLHGVVVERYVKSRRRAFHELRFTLFDFSENRRLEQLEASDWSAFSGGPMLYLGRSGRVIWVSYSDQGLLAISADTLEVLANEGSIAKHTPGFKPAEIRTRVFDVSTGRPRIATGDGRIWSINPVTFQGEVVSGTAPALVGIYPERIHTATYTCEGRRLPHSLGTVEDRSLSFYPEKPPERQAFVAYPNQGPVLIPTTPDSRILGTVGDDIILAESDGARTIVQRLRAARAPVRSLWRIALPFRTLAGSCQLDGDTLALIVQSGSVAFPKYALRRLNIRSGILQE